MSAGAAVVADNRFMFGFPPVTVIGIGLSGKSSHVEWTVIGGRMLVVPGIAVLFGVETGLNISPSGNGSYGGIALSRFGTGPREGIISIGGRLGVRPLQGRGVRYEARVDVARAEDTEILLAYVSIGYDFGSR